MLDSLVNFLTDSDLNFPEEVSRGGDMLVLISDEQEEQHCVFTVPARCTQVTVHTGMEALTS